MIKGTIQQEDINSSKHLCTKHKTHKYVKQIFTDIKGETGRNTVIAGNFNTPLKSMKRKSTRR